MRWYALVFVPLLGCGLANWDPPDVKWVRGTDSRACGATSRCIDLVVALSTSETMALPPGNAPGVTFGEVMRSIFVGDSEASAGSRLWVAGDGISASLEDLDGARVGVGLTGFAGHTAGSGRVGRESWTEVGMTNDYALIDAGLVRMRERGVGGMTCHACAVKLARNTLLPSSGREGHCQVLVLVGGHYSSRPYGPKSDPKPRDLLAANQQEIARELASRRIEFTLVSLGSADDPTLSSLREVLEPGFGEIVVATDRSSVAAAIVKAVDACD